MERRRRKGMWVYNDCAPNRPEKRGFTTLSSVLLYTFTFVMVSCLCTLFFFAWNSSDPNRQIYFMYLLWITKFFCVVAVDLSPNSFWPPLCLCLSLPLYLAISLSVSQSSLCFCLSAHLFVCFSLRFSMCLSLSVSLCHPAPNSLEK